MAREEREPNGSNTRRLAPERRSMSRMTNGLARPAGWGFKGEGERGGRWCWRGRSARAAFRAHLDALAGRCQVASGEWPGDGAREK